MLQCGPGRPCELFNTSFFAIQARFAHSECDAAYVEGQDSASQRRKAPVMIAEEGIQPRINGEKSFKGNTYDRGRTRGSWRAAVEKLLEFA
jgi:hypothetical protein